MVNNSKLLNLLKLILTLMGILFLAAGIIFASGGYIYKVDNIEKKVAEQGEMVTLHDKAIVGIQKDVEYIRGSVDRIERKIDEQ